MRLLILITLAFMLFSTSGITQNVLPMSKDDCVAYAIANKDVMKNIRLDELIALAKNRELTGIALPQINGTAQYQYYISPQQTFLPGEFFGQSAGTFVPIVFTPLNNVNANIYGEQILFDGTVAVALQARKRLALLSVLNIQRSEEDIRSQITKSYFDVQVTRKQLEILSNTYEDLKKLTIDNEKAYRQGVVEKIAVDQSKVQETNIGTQKIELENLLAVNILALKYQMGMPLEQQIILTDSLSEALIEPGDLLDKKPFNYSQRLDYNVMETQLQLNELDLKRYKWEHLPSLRAFGSLGYVNANDAFTGIFNSQWPYFAYIGLNLRVPIFDGLQRRNRVKQAFYKIEQNKNSLQGMRQGIDLQQEQYRTTLKNALQALESQRNNLNLAKSVFDLAEKKYRAGVGSNVEVIQAETSYLQSQSNFFNSLNAAIQAKVDLQKSLGLLKY